MFTITEWGVIRWALIGATVLEERQSAPRLF
jgi:hypothetical protein